MAEVQKSNLVNSLFKWMKQPLAREFDWMITQYNSLQTLTKGLKVIVINGSTSV